jgi:lipopolysaccharide transport protein LptA
MKTLICIAALTIPLIASAERADRFEQTVIASDGAMHYDTIKGVVHANDNVVLTKGSLWIASDTLTVTETPDGYHIYTVHATNGGLARFKQKQDSTDDKWIHGEGSIITYLEKDDLLIIDGHANVKFLASGKVTEQAASAKITYDAHSEQFFAENADGAAKTRSIVTIEARPDPLKKPL